MDIQEAVDQVVEKEGDVVNETPQGVENMTESKPVESQKEEAKPAESQPAQETTAPATEQNVDQQEIKDRARDRWITLTRHNRELKAKLAKYESLEQQKALQPVETTSQKPQEQQEAVNQLRDILGLDKLTSTLEELRNQSQGFTKAQEDQQYSKEDQRLYGEASKMGLKPDQAWDDLEKEIIDHIDNHPILSSLKTPDGLPKPGVREMAFKELYYGRASENGKMLAAKEQAELQQRQKQVRTEHSGTQPKTAPKGKTGDIFKDVASFVSEHGGLDEIEM